MAYNRCVLHGNLCKDVELLNTNNGGIYLRNTIAIQRSYAKEGQERQSDFINIVAYGKSAEFIQKFFQKGDPILIEGRIQTGSYDKEDGTKVYTTDVVAERIYFAGTRKAINNASEIPTEFTHTSSAVINTNDFTSTSDDLPF